MFKAISFTLMLALAGSAHARPDLCLDMHLTLVRSLGYINGIEDAARIVMERTADEQAGLLIQAILAKAQERYDGDRPVRDAAIASGCRVGKEWR